MCRVCIYYIYNSSFFLHFSFFFEFNAQLCREARRKFRFPLQWKCRPQNRLAMIFYTYAQKYFQNFITHIFCTVATCREKEDTINFGKKFEIKFITIKREINFSNLAVDQYFRSVSLVDFFIRKLFLKRWWGDVRFSRGLAEFFQEMWWW